MQTEQNPLILTLRLDAESRAFFDEMRTRYFPPERNFLKAHLTFFHQLPPLPSTYDFLTGFQYPVFQLEVTGLMNLGAGVAFAIEGAEVYDIRKILATRFKETLIPQDLQGFRPHITIQNKVQPAIAKALLVELTQEFKPFPVTAIGLDLWTYLNGPWRHEVYYPFRK